MTAAIAGPTQRVEPNLIGFEVEANAECIDEVVEGAQRDIDIESELIIKLGALGPFDAAELKVVRNRGNEKELRRHNRNRRQNRELRGRADNRSLLFIQTQ